MIPITRFDVRYCILHEYEKWYNYGVLIGGLAKLRAVWMGGLSAVCVEGSLWLRVHWVVE